eukprot:2359836-Amphidinium_carterae.1
MAELSLLAALRSPVLLDVPRVRVADEESDAETQSSEPEYAYEHSAVPLPPSLGDMAELSLLAALRSP